MPSTIDGMENKVAHSATFDLISQPFYTIYMSKFGHKSVLLRETIELLAPKPGESFVDCTLGLAGHSAMVLKKIGSTGNFIGIDADTENLQIAQENLSSYVCSKKFIHSNFLDAIELIEEPVDMILADLGMSSPHIDDPSRGFTFQQDVALDLRYDRTSGETAAELIYSVPEEDLANIFYQYGEIRQSRKLASVCKEVLPKTSGDVITLLEARFGYKGRDLLPQIFQALRIAVNQELDALSMLLNVGPDLLRPGGRLAIISFHSLEDRMVKHAFKERTTPEIDDTTGQISKDAPYILLTKKPVVPTDEELSENPRARSAKLRGIQKRLYK